LLFEIKAEVTDSQPRHPVTPHDVVERDIVVAVEPSSPTILGKRHEARSAASGQCLPLGEVVDAKGTLKLIHKLGGAPACTRAHIHLSHAPVARGVTGTPWTSR
jgi:hypothetical protein